MSDRNEILKQRQCAMRREMDRRGIALKAVSFDSGIPYSTLLSYFPQEGANDPAIMSVAAQYALADRDALPADILSLLLPANKLIVTVTDNIDHDEASKAMRDYIDTKEAAHHPASPAGRDIADCEDATLRGKFAVVAGGLAA